jgi:quercetin dioxygenase-like cupin family protein
LQPTVIALVAGQILDGHDSSGEATLQVLRGRVRVAAGELASDGSAGELLILPADPHTVESLEDAVLLITVVTPPRLMAADPGS